METTFADKVHHKDFLGQLLNVMANATEVAGTGRNVRPRLGDTPDTPDALRVANARFALGGDNGAYLRSNVMPLQTAEVGCDEGLKFGTHLAPEMEAAGQAGVLTAMEESIQKKLQDNRRELHKVLRYTGWLLTIPEVYDFVFAALENRGNRSTARDLVRAFNPDPNTNRTRVEDASQNLADIETSEEDGVQARCQVLMAVRLLLGKPQQIMQDQWDKTLGPAGTGTKQLFDAVDKLAYAARFVPESLESDKVPVKGELLGERAAAAAAGSTGSFLGAATGALVDGGTIEDIESLPDDDGSDLSDKLFQRLRGFWSQLTARQNTADGVALTTQEPPSSSDSEEDAAEAEGEAAEAEGEAAEAAEALLNSLKQQRDEDTDAGKTLRYCSLAGLQSDREGRLAVQAISAGITQMREDGGIAMTADGRTIRGNGVSPFWSPHERILQRSGSEGQEFWRRTLWPGAVLDMDIKELPRRLATPLEPPSRVANPALVLDSSKRALVYCLARGLCASRPPHHRVGDGTLELQYTRPRMICPGIVVTEPINATLDEEHETDCAFGSTTSKLHSYADFVTKLTPNPMQSNEKPEKAKEVLWAPVTIAQEANGGPFVAAVDSESMGVTAVADAVVYEHLVDHFQERLTQETTDVTTALLYKGAKAAAKIKQLDSMGIVMNIPVDQWEDLMPSPRASDGQMRAHTFITRPVLHCGSGKDAYVLYPCDAGLAQMQTTENPTENPSNFEFVTSSGDSDDGPAGMYGGSRRKQPRAGMTPYLRAALGDNFRTQESRAALYIAYEPFTNLDEKGPATVLANPLGGDIYPPGDHSCSSTVRYGVQLCHEIKFMKKELERLKTYKEETRAVSSNDTARERRQAVWNDSMREACISGDRLYAFIRQFSGTISESVDAVCMIDEGMLVRQQQQRRESRARLADHAAQEHMQLVRNVFGAVIRESGLTLGIEKDGNIGQLKVVSNTLRKQASELASGASGSTGGYFANSVRLENLLTQGTGEMTLTDLFGRLKEAGRALQEAAFAAQPVDGVPGAGASLDFLSTPRNSLVLRYKPEALAAIKQAFETFQREMRVQHGRMNRAISAYELIEGNDESLVTAFASFAAHVLVHSRLYSSATAMYVAAWPAAANAQQLKISLQRLVLCAKDYCWHTSRPSFGSPDGREVYFASARRSSYLF